MSYNSPEERKRGEALNKVDKILKLQFPCHITIVFDGLSNYQVKMETANAGIDKILDSYERSYTIDRKQKT